MCGRYAITSPPEAVRAFFAYLEQPNFPPRYNIAPTQPIPIVYAKNYTGGEDRRFLLVRWGFLPGFVKNSKGFPLLINARIEGLADKPSFRAALKRRRCLLIADGFYEWGRAPPRAPRQPYLVRRVDGQPIGLAGLYETWSDPSGGEIDTACIITAPAKGLIANIHDRMPVIVPKAAFSAWHDVDGVDGGEAMTLLPPPPADALELVPVATAVNSAANDGAGLQLPIGETLRVQT